MLNSKPVVTFKAIGPEDWLGLFFGAWLLLTVLTPGDVYRTFFHLLIYPLALYLLISKGGHLVAWKDPFVRLFVLFCGYMSVTTWLVGGGPADNDFQASRWGIEAALGMVAFFFWMLTLVQRAAIWGRWFLVVALIGALAGFVSAQPEAFFNVRLQGLGAMAQPIQGASIATAFLALGLFLTFHKANVLTRKDVLLAAVSLIVVFSFVALTQSRAPLISLTAYLIGFVLILGVQYRRLAAVCISLLAGICFLGLAFWLSDSATIFDQLISRGASHRLELWWAYLAYPPESLLIGNGAGFDFNFTEASRLYLEPRGLGHIEHPHDLWLGAFSETGLIGVALQAGLVLLPTVAVLRSRQALSVKLHLVALLGLFLLLTFSDEFTLLISLHPVWLFGWTLLIFVWTWTRYGEGETATADFAVEPGDQKCR